MLLSFFCFLNETKFQVYSFHHYSFEISYGGNNVFDHATLRNDLLVLNFDKCYNNYSSTFVSYFDVNLQFLKWHARLGHIG